MRAFDLLISLSRASTPLNYFDQATTICATRSWNSSAADPAPAVSPRTTVSAASADFGDVRRPRRRLAFGADWRLAARRRCGRRRWFELQAARLRALDLVRPGRLRRRLGVGRHGAVLHPVELGQKISVVDERGDVGSATHLLCSLLFACRS
jgi:hypothetical protein